MEYLFKIVIYINIICDLINIIKIKTLLNYAYIFNIKKTSKL